MIEPESDVDGNDIVAQAAQGLGEAPGAGKELETKADLQRALGGGGRKGSRCRKNTCSSKVSDISPNLISWAPHKLCWCATLPPFAYLLTLAAVFHLPRLWIAAKSRDLLHASDDAPVWRKTYGTWRPSTRCNLSFSTASVKRLQNSTG